LNGNCRNSCISKNDLCQGRSIHEKHLYKEAIKNLVRYGFLKEYPSQGRYDICIPKQNRENAIEVLESHKKEYDFIKFIEFIK
jgi:hypothetical protein